MKNYRAILIDSLKHEVSLVSYNGSIDEMYKLLKCDTFCTAPAKLPDNNVLFVDDNGLFNHEQGAFKIPFMPGFAPQVLSGNGLIVGIGNDGENANATATLEEITALVKFDTSEKLPEPGFKFIAGVDMEDLMRQIDETERGEL